MSTTTTDGEQDIAARLNALVNDLKSRDIIPSERIEAAFRAVPRHLFVPGVPLDQVYSDQWIITKTLDGVATSSSSMPSIMAVMLEQLGLEPGQRVLEIGAGTGYNAALLAHIVGDAGEVVTVELEEDLAASARDHLAAAGFERVRVVYGDGAAGYAQAAPYDRIILTVGTQDILPVWREQLKPGGRLVMPLAMGRLAQRSIAFEPASDHLFSTSLERCRFMMLRGPLAPPPPQQTPLALGPEPEILLFVDDPATITPDRVYGLLQEPSRDWTTGVSLAMWELHHELVLWLDLHEPRTCGFWLDKDAATRDIMPYCYGIPGKAYGTIGLLADGCLAVLSVPLSQLPVEDEMIYLSPFELGIRSLGADPTSAEQLQQHIIAWNAAGREATAGVRIRAYPSESGYVPSPDEVVFRKRWTHFVFDWPANEKTPEVSATPGV